MIYFYALPLLLVTVALTSAAWQQTFGGFMDLHRVERHVTLMFALWCLGGWLMEARLGEHMAALYERCESDIVAQMRELDEVVFGLLGEF